MVVNSVLRKVPLGWTRRYLSSVPSPSVNTQIAQQASSWGSDPHIAYDPWLPVDLFQRLAVGIHDQAGLEWGTSLVSMAALYRGVTLPMYAGSVLVGRRRAAAAKELTELRDIAKEAVLLKDQKLVHDIDREYKQRMKAHGLSANPLQGLGYVLLCQLPWTSTMFFAIRGMAMNPELFPSFAFQSSFLWLDSLALADPYGILPFASAAAIALSSSMRRSPATGDVAKASISDRDRTYLNYAMRAACFTFLPFAMQLPSGILIFIIFNTVFNRVAVPLIHRLAA
jgi:membrane protein insertase Oxa1/YidC/SpoIIIJ